MVSLGVAPAVLLFMYGIRVAGVSPWLCGPVVVLVPLAGAFRLARFNLLPPKTTSHTDSVGLTISTGGALLALAVLSNLAGAVAPSPVLYLCVTVGVSLLMVSTIAFPALGLDLCGMAAHSGRAGARGGVAAEPILLYSLVGLDECLCGSGLSPCGGSPCQAKRAVRNHQLLLASIVTDKARMACLTGKLYTRQDVVHRYKPGR